MAETIDVAKLVTQYEARTAQFEKAILRLEGKNGRHTKKMRRQFRQVNTSIKEVSRTMQRFAAGFGVGLGAGALAGIPAALNSAVKAGANLQDTAEKVGLTTDRLQELRFAAAQVGLQANTLDMAMQRFSRRIGEAANGSGELKDTLIKLGISVRDVHGNVRPLDDILSELADSIQKAGSRQEKLAIAFKAFDSEGAAFVNALSRGSVGLRELTDAARESAAVIDQEAVAAAKRLDDQWTALTETWKTRLKGTMIEVVRQISGMASVMQNEASMSTARLRDRIIELNQQLEKLPSNAGGIADVVKQRLNKANAELSRREISSFSQSVLNPQTKTQGGAVPATDAETAANKRAIDARNRRNEAIDRTIERLQLELSLIGKTDAAKRAATTIANLELAQGDRRAAQIENLVTKIDMQNRKMQELEDAQKRAAQAAEQARDATFDMFDKLHRGAEISISDIGRLIVQLTQLSNVAGQTGGGGGLLDLFLGGFNPAGGGAVVR